MRLGALALTGLLAGCVPYAYVLPPITVSAAVAGTGPAPRVQGDFRAALRPLGMVEALAQRREDFSLGYALELNALLHGPTLGYQHLLWQLATPGEGPPPAEGVPPPSAKGLRLWAELEGRLLFAPDTPGLGGEGRLRVSFEAVSHLAPTPYEGPSNRGWHFGVMFGELAAAVYVDVGLRVRAGTVEWIAATGVSFTLPASAGAGFVVPW